MTHSVKSLQGDDILAKDGPIGAVQDVYFDDERWAVRYLVVDTGRWLPGKRVLLSPASVDPQPADEHAHVHVELTREQIRNAPDAGSDQPVSRQFEMRHAQYYGYPYYWSGPMLWGAAVFPFGQIATRPPVPFDERLEEEKEAAERRAERGNPHLRSGREVIGYDVEARDGSLGALEDLDVDEKSWAITGMVVDTTKWWPGGEVRISPSEVERIDWNARTLYLRHDRSEIRKSSVENA